VAKGEPAAGFVQATVVAHGTAWVAWLLSRDCWGRGYAVEAIRAMLSHLAASHGVVRCQATVEAGNLRSLRLLERMSFRRATPRELEGHALSPTEQLFVKDPE
jgi:ribosomal-protein-alanine N-acetyltransferase